MATNSKQIESIVVVALSNSGGELDSRVVEIHYDDDNPVKAALLEMLNGIDLDTGDTITVRAL